MTKQINIYTCNVEPCGRYIKPKPLHDLCTTAYTDSMNESLGNNFDKLRTVLSLPAMLPKSRAVQL